MQPTLHASTLSWRPALQALVLALVSILFLYRDTAVAMVSIWARSETFTHAFIVPPITLWLIWRRRQELARLVPKPAWPMLFPVAAVAFAWMLGDLVAVNAVTQLALTALLVLVVPTLLGPTVARAIAFPLLFMFFAVPIGEFMMPQLMDWTADFTIIALRLSGIPVYREGLQFVIPSGNWSVVEACSGVRYLIASVTVGTLFAYLNYQTTKRRVLFVIVSILVPIVANWVRAYMIVMLGHLSGNKLAVGVDHLVYGWAFFGVVIMLMFVIGSRWAEPEPELPLGASDTSAPARSADASSAKLWIAAACLLAVVALPTAAEWVMQRNASTGSAELVAPAVLGAGWQASDPGAIGFKPAFKNPSAEVNGAYNNAGKTVGLYLGYYRDQDYDHKLVSSQNIIVASNDPAWSRVGGGARPATFGQQHATVRTAELRRLPVDGPDQRGRLVVWQIYWIDGTLTASDYLAKAYSAAYRLMGRRDESAVIILYALKDPVVGADATLQSFLSANYGAIDALLRQASRSK